ncbi:uncharacterized protein LOC100127287 [Xenopus laevis]|uniref:Uncharacterized protein LOC100127287 n=3 Tax=Xenopus laevis TaxID=8355 RepID=A0A1L8HAB9_XENLA|nr:uncharacterized protein LOC100127287 [Xenopus laevis]XP_018105678.1 uncharacterized protein LOC100127287 [Xenopus laevis]OCT93043.1 hypothetical protein XELAEV_18016109mg [Xenopus laevis]
MSTSTPNQDFCAFCHQWEQNEETGDLLKTSDDKITAHFYCMIFSPNVIATNSPHEEFGGFDRQTVEDEIKRGKRMKCSKCNKTGATIGCDVKSCRKTYHYMCAKSDRASIIENEGKEQYLIYCIKHREDKQDGNEVSSDTRSVSSTSLSTENSDASTKQNNKRKMEKKKEETPRCKRRLIPNTDTVNLQGFDGRSPSSDNVQTINEDKDADNVTDHSSEIPVHEQAEGLHVGDTLVEHNAVPVSADDTSAEVYAKKVKLVNNSLAEDPTCSAYVKNTSKSQSENGCKGKTLTNPCCTSSPIVQSISVAQNSNSAYENGISVAQPTNSPSNGNVSNSLCVAGSQNEGGGGMEEELMDGTTAVLPRPLPTQSAQPSENIHGMNRRLLEQPVIVPGEASNPIRPMDRNVEQTMSISDFNDTSEGTPECFSEENRASQGEALHYLKVICIPVSQEITAVNDSTNVKRSSGAEASYSYDKPTEYTEPRAVHCTSVPQSEDSQPSEAQCSNVAMAPGTISPSCSSYNQAECPSSPTVPNMCGSSEEVRNAENQEGPFADMHFSTKIEVINEYIRIKKQRDTGAAQQFWTMCQEIQCSKPLLELIENSVRSVTQKVLNGEAENEDYETAFRYLCTSRNIEGVFLQEMEKTIQDLLKAKELLQALNSF